MLLNPLMLPYTFEPAVGIVHEYARVANSPRIPLASHLGFLYIDSLYCRTHRSFGLDGRRVPVFVRSLGSLPFVLLAWKVVTQLRWAGSHLIERGVDRPSSAATEVEWFHDNGYCIFPVS